MQKILPTVQEVNALRGQVPSGPVVMLNLLKFKPGGKRLFLEYAKVSGELMPDGIELVYFGKGGANLATGEDWDFVGLSRYKSFDAFADMFVSERYQNEARPLREQALERNVLMLCHPADLADLQG